MENINIIIGATIIIINLIPILFRKYKLLLVSGAISVLLGILLIMKMI